MAVVGLTCFGLIMVFSSSTVTMAALGKSPFLQLLNQGAFCLIGLVLGFVALMMPVTFWKRTGVFFVVGACLLQALTFTPLGLDVYGNKGWLNLGFTTIQPAEFMKFAMCIWLPSSLHCLQQDVPQEGRSKHYAAPLVLYAIGVALVMGGRDLGTAMILVFIGGVAFLIVGFPGKWMGSRCIGRGGYGRCIGGFQPEPLASYSGPHMAIARPLTRRAYATSPFTPSTPSPPEVFWDWASAIRGRNGITCRPPITISFSRSSARRPGFVGCAIVLLFFAILAWCMIVIALQVTDRYVAMVLMCVHHLDDVGQAMVNIGVVVGVFPVLGVPMPFVSAGGSSMIMCLTAAGLVVGLMRSQPQIKQSRQSA